MFEPRDTSGLTIEQKIQILFDEREIRNVIYRDCRAKSRGDGDLMRTCFFEDAIDHHAPFFDLPFSDVAERTSTVMEEIGEMIQYIALQVLIDLDGDVARVESYVDSNKIFHKRAENGDQIVRLSGFRNLDRFERRNGEWRIAERWFVPEWGIFVQQAPLKEAVASYGVGTEAGNVMSNQAFLSDSPLPRIPYAFGRADPSYTVW